MEKLKEKKQLEQLRNTTHKNSFNLRRSNGHFGHKFVQSVAGNHTFSGRKLLIFKTKIILLAYTNDKKKAGNLRFSKSQEPKGKKYRLDLIQTLREELATTNHKYKKMNQNQHVKNKSKYTKTRKATEPFSELNKDSVIQNLDPGMKSNLTSLLIPSQMGRGKTRNQFLFQSRQNTQASNYNRTYSIGKPLHRSVIRNQSKPESILQDINNFTNLSQLKNLPKFKATSKYGGLFHKYEYIEDPGIKNPKVIKNEQYYRRR